MSRRLRGDAGFTLTEVLVASMLLTIVMTAVYTLFFSVISTWRSEENDEGLHRGARNVLTMMRHEYGNLHAGGSYFFEGGDDEFTMFVIAQPMDVESGEGRHLMRVRYRYIAARRELVREEARVDAALPATLQDAANFDRGRIRLLDEASFVVASGVSRFSVRYLWVQRPDSEYWRGRPEPIAPEVFTRHRLGWGLPQAIEIDLTLEGRREDTAPLSVTAHMPTRTLNRQRDAWELARMRETGT